MRLHLEMNSTCVLNKEEECAFAIIKFFVKHKSHFLVQPLKRGALEANVN